MNLPDVAKLKLILLLICTNHTLRNKELVPQVFFWTRGPGSYICTD